MVQPSSTTDDRRVGPLVDAYGEDGVLRPYVAQGVVVLNPDGSIPSGNTGTSAAQVQGAAAATTTTAVNPMLGGARYNSTLPTYTTGQLGEMQMGARGALNVALFDTASNTSVFVGPPTVAQSTAVYRLHVAALGQAFNGATNDYARKPNVFARVASSAASGNPAVAKASAGDVTMFWGQNGAAITYLQIYAKATAPVIGTDTPVLTYPIAALERFSETIPNGGAYIPTGVAFAFTTDAAATTGAAAAAVTSFALLVA